MKSKMIGSIFYILIILTVVININGKYIARYYYGLVTYFSFQDGPFSWDYDYNDGKVGPFLIGANFERTIKNIIDSGVKYNMLTIKEDDLGVNLSRTNIAVIYNLTKRYDRYAFRTYSSGAGIIFVVEVDNGYIKRVGAAGSFFHGL